MPNFTMDTWAGVSAAYAELCLTVSERDAEIGRLREERDKLQAYKQWTHDYLDRQGVPHHPPGTHGAEGCRIGDRMDYVFAELARLRADEMLLVQLFRSAEFEQAGRNADALNMRPCQAAVEELNRLQENNDKQHKELADAHAFVEREISSRTKFDGNPPYVGWRGLGSALAEALDERDRLREAIITHRSQKADDRCIEDDDRLYDVLGDGIKCDRRVGDKADMLVNCARFIEKRCEAGGWPSYAEVEKERARLREANGELRHGLTVAMNALKTEIAVRGTGVTKRHLDYFKTIYKALHCSALAKHAKAKETT